MCKAPWHLDSYLTCMADQPLIMLASLTVYVQVNNGFGRSQQAWSPAWESGMRRLRQLLPRP